MVLTTLLRQEHLSANHGTVFDLIHSHGRMDLAMFFASLAEDHSRVVRHHIAKKQYPDALAVLQKQPNTQLYYVYASELLLNAPDDTVQGMGR